MKKAFTMLELVMVMVIMGIVASIGADIIVSMYTNYLRSRTINALESKTEIVLEQIAKRLQYRIKESVIARKKSDGSLLALPAYDGSDTEYNVIEWIGYSNESFLGSPKPGWSGFIDLDSSENNTSVTTSGILKTSESNLTDAQVIISALTDGNLTLSDASSAGALIFKGRSYNPSDFGWETTGNVNANGVLLVSVNDETTFKVEESVTLPFDIYEQYYLAHTAYALVPSDTNSTDFNLTLHYNYQPWLITKDFYTDGASAVVAEHVSLFRFRQDESIVRLKLCLHDNNQTGVGEKIVICKEKVVY